METKLEHLSGMMMETKLEHLLEMTMEKKLEEQYLIDLAQSEKKLYEEAEGVVRDHLGHS